MATSERSHVELTDFRMVDGRLWVHVVMLSHSICEHADDPWAVESGWLPAHGSTGEPAVWFFSRGC